MQASRVHAGFGHTFRSLPPPLIAATATFHAARPTCFATKQAPYSVHVTQQIRSTPQTLATSSPQIRHFLYFWIFSKNQKKYHFNVFWELQPTNSIFLQRSRIQLIFAVFRPIVSSKAVWRGPGRPKLMCKSVYKTRFPQKVCLPTWCGPQNSQTWSLVVCF